jgi:hypothetical protein
MRVGWMKSQPALSEEENADKSVESESAEEGEQQ